MSVRSGGAKNGQVIRIELVGTATELPAAKLNASASGCADPDSPYHDKNFARDKTIILYCASGGRSALGGKVLKEMGYDQVYNLGKIAGAVHVSRGMLRVSFSAYDP